ncbi:MAG: ThuA domain-containing protein [Verrucomicrobiota bacterium]
MKNHHQPFLSRHLLLGALALFPVLAGPLAAQAPDSTEPMGQKFASPKAAKTLRVLLVGSGSSHDFPKFFLGTDATTLKAAGGMDVAATPNLDEALALLPEADVLVFSGNHDHYGKPEFQKALNKFADDGKGLVMLHAATWEHPAWKGFNDRFINGTTPGHDSYGDVTVTVTDATSPIMKGVSPSFTFKEENYRTALKSKAKASILAENNPDANKVVHPSVWIVKDRKAKIVCITLGHDGSAHDSADYKAILTNAVNWTAGR